MRKQMGTSTNSGVNECQNAEATLPQQRNVTIVFLEVKCSRELCLNPICSVSFHFHTRQGLKRSMVSDIDFLTRQLSTTVLLSFFPTFILFSSLLLLLHSSPLVFVLLFYLSLSAQSFTLVQLLSIRLCISEKEERKHFQIPSASISQDSLGGLIQSLPVGEVDSDI